jgi:hypothetical protein
MVDEAAAASGSKLLPKIELGVRMRLCVLGWWTSQSWLHLSPALKERRERLHIGIPAALAHLVRETMNSSLDALLDAPTLVHGRRGDNAVEIGSLA